MPKRLEKFVLFKRDARCAVENLKSRTSRRKKPTEKLLRIQPVRKTIYASREGLKRGGRVQNDYLHKDLERKRTEIIFVFALF